MSTPDEWPPNPADTVGQLRYVINDVEEPYAFTDAHLQAMLSIYRDNLQLAGADLIESIAVDEVLLYRFVRTDDLTVDGSKAAEILLKRAQRLREQAAIDAEEDAFEIVEFGGYSGHVYPEAVARWR